MKWMIGIVALATLCLTTLGLATPCLAAPCLATPDDAIASAQDSERDKRIAQIKKLEKQAEKFLDQGRRTAAFDALARAAVLRDMLKKQGPKKDGLKKGAPKKSKKARKSEVGRASDALAKALKTNDMAGIRNAAVRLQQAAVTAEAKHKSALANERRERKRLEARLTNIEQQVAQLKKALDR